MPEFRPVARDERVRHETVIKHAFDADAGPPGYEGPEDLEDRIAERWGLYDDGALRSACVLYDLDVTLADGTTSVGGLGAFATPPEHRSQEYGTELQREALATFHERGYPYAVLWPESIPYYRRHGWGLVHARTKYGFPPAAISDVGADAPDGRFERVRPEEYERLVSVYEGFRRQFVLGIDRTAAWWETRVLADTWTYSWTPDDADVPAGYVVFTLPQEGDDSVIEVDELVSESEGARRALLALIERHAPQVDWVRWRCPEETRLLTEATDPGEVSLWIEPGAMGRIVDVTTALEALPAARNPSDAVTIAIEDSLLPANGGTVVVSPGDDGPTLASSVDGTPDVRIDVGTLSTLYAGTVGGGTYAERESLDEAVGDALTSLFPERRVYLTDFF